MSVKPGVSTKRIITTQTGIGLERTGFSTGTVGSETMNPLSPLEAGRQMQTDGLDARNQNNTATSL